MVNNSLVFIQCCFVFVFIYEKAEYVTKMNFMSIISFGDNWYIFLNFIVFMFAYLKNKIALYFIFEN